MDKKVISVSEETYDKLRQVGGTGQSFNGIITDLIKFKESALQ